MADSEDFREGPRKVDVTIGLHLDSEDTTTTTDKVVDVLRETLEGMSFYVGRGANRRSFVIDSTDEPIHVHSVTIHPVTGGA